MKLSDIFSLNLNSKGGAKLFKKIANKYNLDYKEVRKSVEENVGGGSGAKESYYLFDADKCIETLGISEEDFNSTLSGGNANLATIFWYGALNFIVRGENYHREYLIVNELHQITSVDIFKKVKAIKLYDNINPIVITISSDLEYNTECYNIIGNLEDRYTKQKNISDFNMPNPTLYTTPITKEEYEALIDIPNIIV